MVQSRTHTCNDLRTDHVGQQVKLVGWMENVREVGQNLALWSSGIFMALLRWSLRPRR